MKKITIQFCLQVLWATITSLSFSVAQAETTPPQTLTSKELACASAKKGIKNWGTHYDLSKYKNNDKHETITAPIFPTSISQGSAGRLSCIIEQDDIKCIGPNWDMQMKNKPKLIHPTQVTTGDNHTCALDQEGVKCWGNHIVNNSHSNKGQANVPPLKNPIQVSAGANHTCAIDQAGLHCWGDTWLENRPLLHPTQVSTGVRGTCVIDQGEVKCWENFKGRYLPNRNNNKPVPKLLHPTQISVGGYHTCALDKEGVKCWVSSTNEPIKVPLLKNPTQVSTSRFNSCAIDEEGVKCWGELERSNDSTFHPFKDGTNFKPIHPTQITLAEYHTCAITPDSVQCWGMRNENYLPQQPKGIHWNELQDTSCYLANLSEHMYSFDYEYFSQMSALADVSESPQSATPFILLAMLPHLQQLGYPKVEEGYFLSGNIELMRQGLEKAGYTDLPSLGDTRLNRNLALQILAISLKTASPVLSAPQKAQIEKHLSLLAKVLATDLTNQDLKLVVDKIPRIEKLITEMARNPYLTGRAASALGITRYLEQI